MGKGVYIVNWCKETPKVALDCYTFSERKEFVLSKNIYFVKQFAKHQIFRTPSGKGSAQLLKWKYTGGGGGRFQPNHKTTLAIWPIELNLVKENQKSWRHPLHPWSLENFQFCKKNEDQFIFHSGVIWDTQARKMSGVYNDLYVAKDNISVACNAFYVLHITSLLP